MTWVVVAAATGGRIDARTPRNQGLYGVDERVHEVFQLIDRNNAVEEIANVRVHVKGLFQAANVSQRIAVPVVQVQAGCRLLLLAQATLVELTRQQVVVLLCKCILGYVCSHGGRGGSSGHTRVVTSLTATN